MPRSARWSLLSAMATRRAKYYFNSYPTVAFVHLSFLLRIAKYSTLPVSLEYTLCALPKFADQGPFDRFKSLRNNLP